MPIFTNSQLAKVQLKGEEIMADGQIADQYIANAEAARAILENQTIEVKPLSDDPKKDKDVEVTFIDTCGIEDQECPADVCNFTSPELATKKVPFLLNLCRASFFSVDETDVAKSIYGKDDAVAKGQLTALNKLDEYVSRQALIALNANAGTNLYPLPYSYDPATKSTDIPEADYNRKIVPYFEKMAMMHKIPQPYYIDNGQLWIDWRNAQLDAGNADGRGDKARVDAIKLYFDMFGFAAAGITPDDTFLVGKHAVGIAHRTFNENYVDNAVTLNLKNGNQTRYKVTSNNLVASGGKSIEYDAYYQIECSGKRVKHSWMFVYTGGIFVAPEGCTEGVTGIMSFNSVAPDNG